MTEQGNNINLDYNQLKNAIREIIQDDLGPQILVQTEEKAKQIVDQNAVNQTSLNKLKKKLEDKRKNDCLVFKKQGHLDQFKHNSEVLESIEDAIEGMENADVDQMKASLEKGKQLIESRIKHIRIADAYGWSTVKEFKTNELTCGEAEEKRLKRAIKSAESARDKFKRARTESDKDYNSTIKSKTEQRTKMDDVVCYTCKRVGHYMTHCPFASSSSAYTTKNLSSKSSSTISSRKDKNSSG